MYYFAIALIILCYCRAAGMRTLLLGENDGEGGGDSEIDDFFVRESISNDEGEGDRVMTYLPGIGNDIINKTHASQVS